MIAGLSAFTFTPFNGDQVDYAVAGQLVHRAAAAGVDSLGVLGSTGNYAYLNRDERRELLKVSVDAAEGTPIIAGIGALRTRDVLLMAQDAQAAGVAGLLLAPVSYQPLTEFEVLQLFTEVSAQSSVPIIVYDNPTTTRFHFSDELHGQIARLPQVHGVKLPPPAPSQVVERIARLRQQLPQDYSLGISGDQVAAEALAAGCTTWYSVLGGVLPEQTAALTRAVQSGNHERANELNRSMEPLWNLLRNYGSLRVASALLAELGLVSRPNLPRPIADLTGQALAEVREALELTS